MEERPEGNELSRLWLGEVVADVLWEAGFRTLEDLAQATDEELLAVAGIGRKRLGMIRERCNALGKVHRTGRGEGATHWAGGRCNAPGKVHRTGRGEGATH